MHSVLIIEDEYALVMALQDRLESEGYEVVSASDGIAGQNMACSDSYACILLDVMLPLRDGFQVLRNIRKAGISTPTLMLTARDTTIDTVMGLKLGADDYLTKPFDMQVLLARIEALIRRGLQEGRTRDSSSPYTFGPFTFDREHRQLYNGEVEVPLNSIEFQLLQYLIDHEGKTIARETLLEEVWGYELLVTTRTVDVHIARLRHKLNEGSVPKYIRTVHRMGYRFMR